MATYIIMTDKFLSGWGQADGRTAKFIVECDTLEQAEQIEKAAHRRSDMKNISSDWKRPYFSPSRYQVTFRHYNDLGGVWKE